MTASGTETAVHNNHTAIQALSSPLQAINQAFPLIQQQNDATAITLRAVHQEAHDSRQEARNFRDKVITELTKLVDRVDSSPGRVERNIITSLDHHGAGMSQLKHDLRYAHSQDTNEVVAKLEAIVGVIGISPTTKLTKARTRALKVSKSVLSASQA